MPANDKLTLYLYNGLGSRVLKTSELRVPVTFNRITVVPAETGSDETQTIQPFYNAYAKFIPNKKTIKDGQNADNQVIHQFLIRLDPSLALEASDFVMVDTQCFKIQSVEISKTYKNALEINTTEQAPLDQRDPNIDNTLAQEPKPVDTIKQGDFDTWIS